jgi:Protein of unknown function (DUF2442)
MKPLLTIKCVTPLPDYRLLLLFSTGEQREFDFTPFLTMPVFKPLQDPKKFAEAKLGMMTVIWNEGEIDIAPATLYAKSVNI